MISHYGLKLCIVMLCATLLSACNGFQLYDNTRQNVRSVQTQMDDMQSNYATLPVTRYSSASAQLPPARWLSQPSWMHKSIVVRGKNMSFDIWNSRILGQTGANIAYQAGMNKNATLSMDYSGTVRGALDKLAATTGYAYVVDGNTVNWSEFVTKTFDISFMPGAAQYSMGGQAGGTNAVSTNNTASNITNGQTMTNQFSNLQGNLSVWNDIEKSIKSMLSKEGSVVVSQATTTVTVRDHAENVRLISDYLASMNKDLSRQVALQVQVLQINLDKAFSYGINWNMISGRIHALGDNSINLRGGIGGAEQGTGNLLTSLGNDLTQLGGIGATGVGVISGSNQKFLLDALEQQGNVSVVTQPTVVTLNNQVAQIAITTQKSYLASITSTNTAQVGNQVSLTPGTVTTGFTLYTLPKIMGNNVFLQLTSELSSLDSLNTFSANTGTVSNTSQSGANQIQQPTVTSKSFNQRTMVPSGATLILSGFRQVTNQANKSSFFGIDPLGGKGAQQNNKEIIVLITPMIMGNNG